MNVRRCLVIVSICAIRIRFFFKPVIFLLAHKSLETFANKTIEINILWELYKYEIKTSFLHADLFFACGCDILLAVFWDFCFITETHFINDN